MSYGLGQYKRASVHTASKEKILLMLYQSAISNCKKAIDAIEKNQMAQKGEYIGKLQDIVIELNNSLDFKVDKGIAGELSSLYDYILFSSTRANLDKDKKPLESCLKVLKTLHDGWDKAIKSLSKNVQK